MEETAGYLDIRSNGPAAICQFKRVFGGLTIVSVGESFTSAAYSGRFVPYEIRFKSGGVKKHNLALKQDPKSARWYLDGGL